MIAGKLGAVSRIAADGKVTQLDRSKHAGEVVTSKDVEDKEKLAKLLTDSLATQAQQDSRAYPRRTDFMDVVVDSSATTLFRFRHNFGGRVSWWIIDFVGDGVSGAPALERVPAETTNDELVLISYIDGVVSIRVEESL